MLRAVLDSNVIVAALKSRSGASYELLHLAEDRYFQPALSVPLVTEYEDVLHRPNIGIDLNSAQIRAVLDRLCKLSINQDIHYLWRPFLQDPKDDMVFEAAIASNSPYIITFNTRDFKQTTQFGVKAITPATFLQIL